MYAETTVFGEALRKTKNRKKSTQILSLRRHYLSYQQNVKNNGKITIVFIVYKNGINILTKVHEND